MRPKTLLETTKRGRQLQVTMVKKVGTIDHLGQYAEPLICDHDSLIETEFFRDRIIRIEVKHNGIGQEAINTQFVELDVLIFFGGSWIQLSTAQS